MAFFYFFLPLQLPQLSQLSHFACLFKINETVGIMHTSKTLYQKSE